MTQIQIQTKGGLCNRLRTLYPYLQYCIKNNFYLKVLWEVRGDCPAKFCDLFDPHPFLEIIYTKDQLHGNLDWAGCNVPQCIKDITDYRTCYLLFNPKNYIREIINEYILSINNINYNAVHIRRTDHVNLAKKNKCFTEDKIFFDYIEQSNLPVYVATDCEITQNILISKFKDKILIYKKIEPKINNLRQTSVCHAVIDIILCSRSINFRGSGYSSFSNFITGLKNCGFKLNLN